MQDNERLVREYFDEEGITYEANDGFLKIPVKTPNVGDFFFINLGFDSGGLPIYNAVTWGPQNLCFKGKELLAFSACNEINRRCKFVKFYLDTDGDIACYADTFVSHMEKFECGAACKFLIDRMESIFDREYPTLRAALLN